MNMSLEEFVYFLIGLGIIGLTAKVYFKEA
jgi:hypothetical protein